MMDQPLLISSLLVHAETYHGDTEIVSRRIEPAEGAARFHRYGWRQLGTRARQLAQVLSDLGVRQGDRVGTLAWNGYRHLELYFAVSGSGAVIHTINPRLLFEQIAWMIGHAEDRVIFFDINLASLIEQIMPLCPQVRAWVAMTDATHMAAMPPQALCYETLLESATAIEQWPGFDERQAAGLCYTSGTTGNPKGVLYAHRSTLLHAYAICMPDVLGLSASDCVLPIVPMFHANAWGIPYGAPLTGCKLVLPGNALDGASLCELFAAEGVTFSAGVPTVWLGMLQHVRTSGVKLPAFKRCLIGGAACPQSLKDAFRDELGVDMRPSWGMTELSPLGAVNAPKRKHLQASSGATNGRIDLKAGRPAFGVRVRIVDADGRELPRDGLSAGDLLVQGAWVIDHYFKGARSPLVDGWFPTGDVATIDADGFIQITDRSKDVIKSGGEWISSIELENIAMSHPAVAEAAAIAVPHVKWDERPLLVVVRKPGQSISRDELLRFFDGKIAKWWMPDDIAFVDQLPHTATGKVSKLKLREDFSSFPVNSF